MQFSELIYLHMKYFKKNLFIVIIALENDYVIANDYYFVDK